MKMFDVYNVFDLEIIKGRGSYVWDKNGHRYLDFYGGHAVISIGHSHPHQIAAIKNQLDKLMFYSNSIVHPLQHQLADHLGKISGLDGFQLFLVNSGAEANENALKLASFQNPGRKTILAFQRGFHGRTSAAVNVTDNPKIKASINNGIEVIRIPFNNMEQLDKAFHEHEFAAVILECIQGVGGIYSPSKAFIRELNNKAKRQKCVIIADEIQSGTARSGHFFAFQKYTDFEPDIVTVAKGIGNGFPVGMVLIAPHIPPTKGILGTTFGGNQLACAASKAVLEVIESEDIISNVRKQGDILKTTLQSFSGIKEVRGEGLMIGIELDFPIANLRKTLLHNHKIFTGSSAHPNTIRILPSLNVNSKDVEHFLNVFYEQLTAIRIPQI